MPIVQAAADRCELLWLVDRTHGNVADMFPLLRRYGTVLDISGSSSREAATILAPYKLGRAVVCRGSQSQRRYLAFSKNAILP